MPVSSTPDREDPTTRSPYSRHGTPAPLAVAAGLTFVQGLLTVLFGVAEAVQTDADRWVMGLTTSAFFVVFGCLLGLCAWGLHTVRPWARGPVLFTQLLQQPVTTNITINTTVAIPDGGTVLMGGLKKLSESRSEFGPPILSKVPYINRLFKNVGYGRETDSMLIMVTPRIIVQAEEEERQTGFSSAAAGGSVGS